MNEAYMRLADVHQMEWKDRGRFIRSWKLMAVDKASDLVDLDDALNEMEKVVARKARVVELRFFAGLTVEEAAEVLGVSAKTWLARELFSGDSQVSHANFDAAP